MSHFGRLFKSVSIYGVGNILLRLFGFITIPVFTRIFSPSDYGIMEAIGSFTAALGVFAMLSLDSANQRSFFDYSPNQQKERTDVLSTTFWTLLVWCTFISVSGVLANRLLGNVLFQDSSFNILLVIAILGIPVTKLMSYFQSILNLWRQPARYVMISIFYSILTVGASIYLAAVLHLGLLGYYLGILIGGFIALGLSFWFVRSGFRFTFSFRELRVMLAYSLPLVPTAAFTWIVQSADRFFLLRYATTADVGWYSLGVRLSSLLTLITAAFGIAWAPFILDLHNRDPENEPVVRARTFNYLTAVLAFCALVLSIFAREALIIIASPAFVVAYQVVGLLAGGIVLIGLNAIVMTGISLSRQTKYFFWGTLVSAFVNTVLNFILIPPLAMHGAALATFFSYATLFIFYLVVAQKLSPAPYKYKKLSVIFLVTAVLIAIGTFINYDSIFASLIVKSMLIIIYPILIWLLGGLSFEEVKSLSMWVLDQLRNIRKIQNDVA
jgi:O-antigen/teichoic acid export membrane protein